MPAGRLPSASLWAAVPTYVPGAPSPKAALALDRADRRDAHGVPVITTDLEIAAASYERQINELVASDEDTAAYVARLEAEVDDVAPDLDDLDDDAQVDDLVEEVERFLRNPPDD